MKKFSQLLSISLVFISCLHAMAQTQVAQIKDEDGYTNIRSGPGANHDVVGIVKQEDLFYCEPSETSDWYRVNALKWAKNGTQLSGYIHKSRIQLVDDLPCNEKRLLIEGIFKEYRHLIETYIKVSLKYDRFNETWPSKADSITHREASSMRENYSDVKYSPILEVFSDYFCKTGDEKIMQKLLNIMWMDRGSANEMPSFTIGYCFICKSDLIIELLMQQQNEDKRAFIVNHIAWGLRNNFYSPENPEVDTNEEYKRLSKKLEKL